MDIVKLYVALLRGVIFLALIGYLSDRRINDASSLAAYELRVGLISLKDLNHQLGM